MVSQSAQSYAWRKLPNLPKGCFDFDNCVSIVTPKTIQANSDPQLPEFFQKEVVISQRSPNLPFEFDQLPFHHM